MKTMLSFLVLATFELLVETAPNPLRINVEANFTDYVESILMSGSIFEINRGLGLKNLLGGDILPRDSWDSEGLSSPITLWPSAVIPYEYSSNLSLQAMTAVEIARRDFKLRTCVDFVERSAEDNYVLFKSLDGCYSHVGVNGGAQVLSLGEGCGNVGTAIHEMMHAIGFWHEQSRADRDDYVDIIWENIDPGDANNFEKYDWYSTDPRRLYYDFNSIMHYGPSDFSINGGPTMVTHDSSLTAVMGQSGTFSPGDAERINRMYGCGDVHLYSYSCDFEDESRCGYVSDSSSESFDWIRYDLAHPNDTISNNLPSMDSSHGQTGRGSFMVANLWKGLANFKSALRMLSMRFSTRSDVQCLQFWYYISNRSGKASLSFNIGQVEEDSAVVTNISESILDIETDSETHWKMERITISAPLAYRLVITAHVSSGFLRNDVIAIDDISVQDKACETSHFVTYGYSEILETYSANQSFTSSVMHTDDGYAFVVKVFPVGTSDKEDSMGLYFGLVAGSNDTALSWPFCHRYVQLSVVDQSPHPLHAMNQYTTFMTCDDQEYDYIWEKPDPNGTHVSFGSQEVMSLYELTSTHHYLKFDSLLVSVLVTDMSRFARNVTEDNSGSTASRVLHWRIEIYVITVLCVFCSLPAPF